MTSISRESAALVGLLVFAVAGGSWVSAAPSASRSAADEAAARAEYLSKLPPMIDRETFFDDPEISGAQISPDGRFVSFRKPYRDVMNIWVKGLDEPFDAAQPITADTERPVIGYFWTEDGRYVLYVQDKGGDENYHVYKVDPTADAEEETGVPPAVDLTPIEGVRAQIYAVPEKTPNQILIGLNDRDAALHDVYRLDLRSGERELLIRNEENIAGWVADLEGNVRLGARVTDDGGTEILEVGEDGSLTSVYSCSFEETCGPLRFHKDGKRLYMVTNKGEDKDLTELVLFDLETRETTFVEKDPDGEVDFGGPIFSDKTEELIGTVYVGDRVRIYPRDKKLARDLKFLRKKLPDGDLGLGSSTEDERYAIVSVSRDVNPGSVYFFDRKEREVEKLYDSRPELPEEHLAKMKPVRYTARDGMEIPAYLTLPKGVPPRDLPTIIMPHGGPWARDTWGYDSFAQFLANRGYAVFQPNFRGSTGFGKLFLNAGNKEWGTGAMQHDLTDGVKHLIDEGISDPDRVAIMGGSYGGYATLAGLAFTPKLFAAGVSIVGPSNILTLLDSIPPYWAPIKKVFHLRVGDPEDPEDLERLKRQSPLFSATKIEAPLLVIQGANDPRVKKAESDQIVVALRELDREVEYLVAPDEGHGFAGRENRLAMMTAIEEFLAEQLGGRYQEDMSAEIDERLDELTVDVATVELAEVPEEAETAKTAPLPDVSVSALEPVTLHYQSRLEMGGQELTIDSTRELAMDTYEERPVWRVVTKAESPMGSAADTFYLDRDTLKPVHRSVQQGPVSVELDYGDDRIQGRIKAGPQEMPVDAELQAPVFGEDAALETVLLALPLGADYETTVRVFETMSQRVRPMAVKVIGSESAEVAAGQFDTYKLELTSLDGDPGGGTLWIAADPPRKVVRAERRLPPAAGGGLVTSELLRIEGTD